MKILVCTKTDIFGALILNFLFRQIADHELKIVLSDKTRPAESAIPELIDEKFIERDLPNDILFPLIDRQAEHGSLLTFGGLEKRYSIPINKVNNINSADIENSLREWMPDVIISVRFSLIFKSNILSIPRCGAFNVHPGRLPGYAGLMAPFRALLNGESHLGCTVHRIDTGIDTGPIYSISYIAADPVISVVDHTIMLYEAGLINFIDLLRLLVSNHVPELTIQDPSEFQYFHFPGKQEFDDARKKGVCMCHLPSYITLLRRFVPNSLQLSTLNFLDVEKLEQIMKLKGNARSSWALSKVTAG